MSRIFSVAALLVLVAAVAFCQTPGPTCLGGVKSCVGEGDLCFSSSVCDNLGQKCDRICPSGLACRLVYPEGINRCGTVKQGDICTQDSDCATTDIFQPEMICSKSTLRCIPSQEGRITNDFCSSNDQCTLGVCENGRCTGKPAGDVCNSDSECAFGLWCADLGPTNNCTAQQNDCPSGDSDQCLSYTASCVNNVCTPMASNDFGGSCAGSSSNEGSACVKGLNCVGGQCQDSRNVNNLLNANCTADESICGSILDCQCDGATARGDICVYRTFNTCPAEFIAYRQCLFDNQCRTQSENDLVGACARERCGGLYNAYINCKKDPVIETERAYTSDSCLFRFSAASEVDSFLLF